MDLSQKNELDSELTFAELLEKQRLADETAKTAKQTLELLTEIRDLLKDNKTQADNDTLKV